jgi:hypothetical protein
MKLELQLIERGFINRSEQFGRLRCLGSLGEFGDAIKRGYPSR